jgi:hypothetical protein
MTEHEQLEDIILDIVHQAGQIERGKTVTADMFPETITKLEALMREARVDEQKRSSPRLTQNSNSVTASIIVAVSANSVVSQADRIASLTASKDKDAS